MEQQPIRPRVSDDDEKPKQSFKIQDFSLYNSPTLAEGYFKGKITDLISKLANCRVYRVTAMESIIHSGPYRVRLHQNTIYDRTPYEYWIDARTFPADAFLDDADVLEYSAARDHLKTVFPEECWTVFATSHPE